MEEVAATAALVASSCYENHPCGTEGADAGINPTPCAVQRTERAHWKNASLIIRSNLQHIMTNLGCF